MPVHAWNSMANCLRTIFLAFIKKGWWKLEKTCREGGYWASTIVGLSSGAFLDFFCGASLEAWGEVFDVVEGVLCLYLWSVESQQRIRSNAVLSCAGDRPFLFFPFSTLSFLFLLYSSCKIIATLHLERRR